MTGSKAFLMAVIKRELNRIRHNRAYQFLLLIGPLIGILLVFAIFYKGVVRELPIAIVNQDQSSLSVKLGNAINASPDVEVVVHANDVFQTKQLLEKGDIEAVIIIPKNTEKHIFQDIEAPIPLYINGTNVLKASLIQRSVVGSVKTVSAGVQMKKLMPSGKTEKEAITRIMPVKIEKHVLFNPYTNYNYFLGSALMYVMLYLFVILSATYTLGNELKRGTGQTLLDTANNSVRLAVIGKLLPYTVFFTVFATFINFLLYGVDGMPMNGNFLVIFLGQFVTIVSYQFIGLIFIGATSNLRLALSLVSAYAMMAITFSGLTFPLGYMPKAAQVFGAVFPFTWWEKILISQSFRGAPLDEVLPYILYLLIFQAVGLFFLKMYKKHLGDPSCWGNS